MTTVDSWRRHYKTLARRDERKPDLVQIQIPLDLILYFSPPGFFISMPHGNFIAWVEAKSNKYMV